MTSTSRNVDLRYQLHIRFGAEENLDRVTRSQDLLDAYKLTSSSWAFKYLQETKRRSSNVPVIYFQNE